MDGQRFYVNLGRHGLTVAGSGAGKGSCQIIPNLLEWPESAVLVDPKGEGAELTASYRKNELGQKVAVFDPFLYANVDPSLRASLNPLDLVRDFDDINTIASGLVAQSDGEKDPHWSESARLLLMGTMAFVLSSPGLRKDQRNLLTVSKFLSDLQDTSPADPNNPKSPTIAAKCKAALQSCTAFGGIARQAAAMVTDSNETASFFKNFNRQTQWLYNPEIQAFLSTPSSVDLNELKHGRMTIYFVIPPNKLKLYARFLRLFTTLTLETMWQKMPDGSKLGTRCLFILDEFPALGKLDNLTIEGLPQGRAFGLHVWPFCQNWGQLVDVYGETGAEHFLANCDAFCVYGLDEMRTADIVSDMFGRVTVAELEREVRQTRTRFNPVSVPRPDRPDRPDRNKENLPQASDQWQAEAPLRHRHDELMGEIRQETRQNAEWRSRQSEENDKERRRLDEERGNIERSLILGRSGTPRLPADEIIRKVAISQSAPEIAREMLVRLRGNDWRSLKPCPWFPVEKSGSEIEEKSIINLLINNWFIQASLSGGVALIFWGIGDFIEELDSSYATKTFSIIFHIIAFASLTVSIGVMAEQLKKVKTN